MAKWVHEKIKNDKSIKSIEDVDVITLFNLYVSETDDDFIKEEDMNSVLVTLFKPKSQKSSPFIKAPSFKPLTKIEVKEARASANVEAVKKEFAGTLDDKFKELKHDMTDAMEESSRVATGKQTSDIVNSISRLHDARDQKELNELREENAILKVKISEMEKINKENTEREIKNLTLSNNNLLESHRIIVGRFKTYIETLREILPTRTQLASKEYIEGLGILINNDEDDLFMGLLKEVRRISSMTKLSKAFSEKWCSSIENTLEDHIRNMYYSPDEVPSEELIEEADEACDVVKSITEFLMERHPTKELTKMLKDSWDGVHQQK